MRTRAFPRSLHSIWALGAFLLCSGFPGALYAGDSEGESALAVHGYYKNFFTALAAASVEGSGAESEASAPGVGSAGFRLKAGWNPAAWCSVQLAYELTPFLQPEGSSALNFGLFQPGNSTYRVADLDTRLYPAPDKTQGNFSITQNLDRILVTGSTGWGDFLLGRQPVAWGSAHGVNPTDILAPFTNQALDKEERTGVDALRFKMPLGAMGELDAGWVCGHNAARDQSAFFIKPRINAAATDWTLVLMDFQNHALIGLDVSRSLGGASLWWESAYVRVGQFDERQAGEDYVRSSLGADYQLTDALYGYAEYHYSSAGAAQPGDYPDLAAHTAYRQGGVYLLGRHYLSPGLTYQISPLWNSSLGAMINLTDASVFLSPSLAYSAADNVELDLGAMLGLGRARLMEKGGADGTEVQTQVRSEFGTYPQVYYTSLKLYF